MSALPVNIQNALAFTKNAIESSQYSIIETICATVLCVIGNVLCLSTFSHATGATVPFTPASNE